MVASEVHIPVAVMLAICPVVIVANGEHSATLFVKLAVTKVVFVKVVAVILTMALVTVMVVTCKAVAVILVIIPIVTVASGEQISVELVIFAATNVVNDGALIKDILVAVMFAELIVTFAQDWPRTASPAPPPPVIRVKSIVPTLLHTKDILPVPVGYCFGNVNTKDALWLVIYIELFVPEPIFNATPDRVFDAVTFSLEMVVPVKLVTAPEV